MNDSERPLVLVVNPQAGKGRAATELVRLRHFLARQHLDADVFLTQGEGDAQSLLDGLSLRPGTIVVAVGGDGTAHEVGSALLERDDVSMGVVPVGSGNDYASLLGMPPHPLASLDAIINGHDERWDVGLIGSEPFINTVGFGFSASVSYHSRDTGALRGLPRYLLALARAFKRYRPLKVAVDGLSGSGPRWITLMEVGIGNRCGGGFHLTAQADPTDGLLDVCLVDAVPRLRIPFLLPRAMRGGHLGHKLVQYEQVKGFRLRVESDSIIHLDGEVKPLLRGEHSIRVKPRALTVRIPGSAQEPTDDSHEEAA